MKSKGLIIILFLIGVHGHSLAQCDNKVSTDPNAPTNEELPDVFSSGAPYVQDVRYLNGLNWWSPNQYALTNMQYNPGQPYGTMSNIQSANALTAYSYLSKFLGVEEMTPGNGWELLLVNLGRYPDNVTVHNSIDLQTIPYLVLYNRYTGVLRVFVQYGYNQAPNDALDGVMMTLKYDTDGNQNNVSGILRLGEGMDQTLDVPTDIEILSAIAPPSGASNFWMSGDFQVTYDPCVCSYPTSLRIEFQFFSTTDLELYGRGVKTEEALINPDGTINNADFLSGIDYTNNANGENGYVMYRKLGTLIDDYIEEKEAYLVKLAAVNEHNDKVEKDLIIVNAIKDLVVTGLDASLGAVTSATWFLGLQREAGQLIGQDSIDLKGLVDEGEKILGKELTTFISSKWSKQTAPHAPSMPTASFSEMRFSGQLENTLDIGAAAFKTPGSFHNNSNATYNPDLNSPYGYPVYNQPLGVFALLEKPKIEVKKGTKMKVACTENTIGINGFNTLVYDVTKQVKNGWQYQLIAPPVYTLNPVLDIKEHQVYYALEVIYRDKTLLPGYHKPSYGNLEGSASTSSTCEIRDYSYNVTSEHLNTYQDDIIYKAGVKDIDTIVYQTPFVKIEALNSIVAEIYQEVVNNYHTTQQDCNNYGSFYLNNFFPYGDAEFEWSEVEVRLKLKVDVNYNSTHDNGDEHTYTYNFTYPIEDQDIIDGGTFLNNGVPRIGEYENLSFFNEHFDGSPVDGCELSGNTYTCKCWNDLKINGNITVANGYNVKMWAGNEINVVHNSSVSPEVVLEIVPVVSYTNPILPATNSYVYNFCQGLNVNSPNYLANTTSTKNHSEIVLEDEESSLEESTYLDVILYPNPAEEKVQISLKTNTNEDAIINLYTLSGKLLKSIGILAVSIDNESEIVNLDLSNYAKGFYFIKVNSGSKEEVKKLIIK